MLSDIFCPVSSSIQSQHRSFRTGGENEFLAIIANVGASVGDSDKKRTGQILRLVLFSSGRRTRTTDLRVMSPTSYQLLYPAMFGSAKVAIIF